ncbi:hypothetical protein ACROYT_G017919 [Oculina patagonica]
MKLQVQLSAFVFTLFLFGWVDCANVPSCASMRSWFPGTPPASFADNLPYQLSVTGYVPKGETVPVYTPESSHTVYLNGSMTAEQKMRSFVGFIIYAENSVKNYTNGHFVTEDLPAGVEVVNCSTLQIVQNSTSAGNWTSLKLNWKAPKDYYAGNVTFRASVLLQTNPNLVYYEGFKAQLRYECPLRKCVACPGNLYKYDSYGCRTCECSGSCEFVCKEIYAPVCGTDGKTYGNKCFMELEACTQKKNVSVAHNGECSDCNFVCAEIYAPVCGTDGETYGNECSMESEACEKKKDISVAHKGECSGAARLGFPGLSLMFAFLAFLWFSV